MAKTIEPWERKRAGRVRMRENGTLAQGPGVTLDWTAIWHSLEAAQDQEMRDIGTEIVNYLRSQAPSATSYDEAIRALNAIHDHFARHKDATYDDPEIAGAMRTLEPFTRGMNSDDARDPDKVLRAAVGLIAYYLAVQRFAAELGKHWKSGKTAEEAISEIRR